MLQFAPSVVAAASVYLALATLRHTAWSATLTHYTALESGDVAACVDALRRCHGDARNPRSAPCARSTRRSSSSASR